MDPKQMHCPIVHPAGDATKHPGEQVAAASTAKTAMTNDVLKNLGHDSNCCR